MIKNIENITTTINHFHIHRLEWILNFNFYAIKDNYFETISIADITFLIKEEEITYELLIRFSNIEALRFEFRGTPTQISGFSIRDLTNNGYHPMKYEVEDYEDGDIHFYCAHIEFLSIIESEYFSL